MQPPAKCGCEYIGSHLHSFASGQGLEPVCRAWPHLTQSQYVKSVMRRFSRCVCRNELFRAVWFRGSRSHFLPSAEVATTFRGVFFRIAWFPCALCEIVELWTVRVSTPPLDRL